jgi:hypothetical protein
LAHSASATVASPLEASRRSEDRGAASAAPACSGLLDTTLQWRPAGRDHFAFLDALLVR